MNLTPRILVVEDDAPTAASIVRALRAEGHDVELEVRGDRALATVHASRFDLVILDLRLPEVHGFEILEALRHRGHASVLVVSASSELEARLRASSWAPTTSSRSPSGRRSCSRACGGGSRVRSRATRPRRSGRSRSSPRGAS